MPGLLLPTISHRQPSIPVKSRRCPGIGLVPWALSESPLTPLSCFFHQKAKYSLDPVGSSPHLSSPSQPNFPQQLSTSSSFSHLPLTPQPTSICSHLHCHRNSSCRGPSGLHHIKTGRLLLAPRSWPLNDVPHNWPLPLSRNFLVSCLPGTWLSLRPPASLCSSLVFSAGSSSPPQPKCRGSSMFCPGLPPPSPGHSPVPAPQLPSGHRGAWPAPLL